MVPAVSAAAQEGWQPYKAGAYGFSMPVPQGTKLTEKEFDGGWGGLHANYEGVELFAVARLGEYASAEDIEKFALRLTETTSDTWTEVDKGRNARGWYWYRVVTATKGDTVVFGGYGIGHAGSYLLLLKTTKQDFKEHEADYKKWYEGVRLHEITDAPKGWEMFRAPDYGFSMLIPSGAKVNTRETDDGWGALHCRHEGVELFGIMHVGGKHEAEAIERFGAKITGIAAGGWTAVDRGEDRRGCSWFRTVRAERDGKVYFGGYGQSTKGSFLMVLAASKDDFQRHRRQYMTWYASVLFK
jgi:hypothetical protein